jgi:hypothetical protein
MRAIDKESARRAATLVLGSLTLALALTHSRPALGGRRIAVLVGNNVGGANDEPLRFAQRDARRVAQALRELGAVEPNDLHLLLERDASEVRELLHAYLARDEAAQAEDLFLFYYSGHADQEALRLGSTRLAWSELRTLLTAGKSDLRVAMVDACQAGMLTGAKGFIVEDPPGPSRQDRAQGYALMVAAESAEIAQESLALGGSYFTHFLVSALRGAGDVDGDGRVTLSEAHSYATKHTRSATSQRARAIQHPAYHFDISGHGDVVLTDLRRATAKLHLSAQMSGHLVVTERGSSLVAAETEKRSGRDLTLALPNGRYVVHLRKPKAVFLDEVALPWGGTVALDESSMTAQTYQAVAQKHGVVEVYRNRARLAGVVHSPILAGLGLTSAARLEIGRKIRSLELAVRGSASGGDIEAVDTNIDNRIMGFGVVLAYEQPVGLVDLRLYGVVEGLYWRQRVAQQGTRTSSVLGLGLGAGARVPVVARLFAEAGIETTSHILRDTEDAAPSIRQSLGGTLALGWMF